MIGRWLGSRRNTTAGGGPLSALRIPTGAGVVAGRVLDPVDEVAPYAEFTLTDAHGRKAMGGGTDPFGGFLATVPPGEYTVAVAADGFLPHRSTVQVPEGELASAGDIRLRPAPPAELPPPGDWEIDPSHTTVGFTARHIGLARVHGRFDNFAGVLRVGESMERSAMHVVIDATSINTNVRMRDDHLRSADFLDVATYPTLEFYGDRFTHRGGDRWHVSGGLSLHGVTRTVTLDTQYLGVGTGLEGETRVACRATAELHRDDFTVSWKAMVARGIAVVGPSIRIGLDVQVVPQG
ncbi:MULTISPECIES: YceI family protein [Streptomyces]|uniref:YceI family protein n=1 Tax=Streptomyces TaxID=1883 RepID=UPI00140D69E6|nr:MULTISPECIES: YceI family protein [Streptomyces]MDH6227018.1 polyisoprenoid-binding protein YceI [Streptomyces sp. MJP52]